MWSLIPSLLLFISPSLLVHATSYPKTESWSGQNFFQGFNYDAAAYDNTTNGDVFWGKADNTSLYSVNDAGRVILKVDNTSSVVYNEKRWAPKVLSKTAYSPGTVWVMDAVHLPYGCGVWPGFWTQGPNWPTGGEIDIFEGINLVTTNQVALHTVGSGCLATSVAAFSGDLTYNNCSTAANFGSGCTVNETDTASYGAAFANAGGGVYIAEFATESIKVWFFTRSAVPSNITVDAASIETSGLGEPVAEYDSSSCDFSTFFGAQTLTIDITLCGDYAGTPSLLEATCGALATNATCYTTYVINDQSTNLANAYFELNYVNVFSSSETKSNSTGGTGQATTTTTAGLSTTVGLGGTATATGKNGAGGKFHLHWEGVTGILLAVGLGAAMLL
ncbi:hypothetical protein P7C73_g2792, partial [Tremellales sp. Uapishka_1]